MVPFSLSLSDLMLIPSFAQAFGENNEKKIKEILFNNGMDIFNIIDEVVCTHRNLRGQVVNCLRYESTERQDSQWINSQYSSWDAKVEAIRDGSFRAELKHIGRQGSADKAFLDEIAGKQAAREERSKGI